MLKATIKNAVQIRTRTHQTQYTIVPGIVAGVAYTAGDAMGQPFTVALGGESGIIQTVLAVDMDKESKSFDILFFREAITPTADNSPFDLSDDDRHKYAGHIKITPAHYSDLNDNSVVTKDGIGFAFAAPGGRLWVQTIARDVQNWAAATDLSLSFVVLTDSP